jgi:hypothetical protein
VDYHDENIFQLHQCRGCRALSFARGIDHRFPEFGCWRDIVPYNIGEVNASTIYGLTTIFIILTFVFPDFGKN